MDRQALMSHTMKINAKIAKLQDVLTTQEDKNSVMAAFYELDDYVSQLERGLVMLYDISEDDINEFEQSSFLQDVNIEDGVIK